MNLHLALLTLLLAALPSAFAQHGGIGGGTYKEKALKTMMLDLIPYLESPDGMKDFKEVGDYNRENPLETISDLLRKTSITFVNGPVRDGFDRERDCVGHFSDKANRYIECNNNASLNIDDLNAQPNLYGFLFHEILVQAVIEFGKTATSPSDYHVSGRLKFHKEVYEKIMPGENGEYLSAYGKQKRITCYVPKLEIKFTKFLDESGRNRKLDHLILPNTGFDRSSYLLKAEVFSTAKSDEIYYFNGRYERYSKLNPITHPDVFSDYQVPDENLLVNFEAQFSVADLRQFGFAHPCNTIWFHGTYKSTVLKYVGADEFLPTQQLATHPMYCALISPGDYSSYTDESGEWHPGFSSVSLFPQQDIHWAAVVKRLPPRCPLNESPGHETDLNHDPFENFTEKLFWNDAKIYENAMIDSISATKFQKLLYRVFKRYH